MQEELFSQLEEVLQKILESKVEEYLKDADLSDVLDSAAADHDFGEELDKAAENFLQNYDFDSAIESALSDFNLDKYIRNEMGDHDFSDYITDAVNDADIPGKVEEAITDYMSEHLDAMVLASFIRAQEYFSLRNRAVRAWVSLKSWTLEIWDKLGIHRS